MDRNSGHSQVGGRVQFSDLRISYLLFADNVILFVHEPQWFAAECEASGKLISTCQIWGHGQGGYFEVSPVVKYITKRTKPLNVQFTLQFSPTSSGAWKYWQAWRSRHGLCQYDGYILEYVHNLPQTNSQLPFRDNSLPVRCPSLPHMGAQHYTKAPHIVTLTSKTSSNKLFNLISCMRRKNSLSLMTSSLSLLEIEDDSFTVIACSLWFFSCRSRKRSASFKVKKVSHGYWRFCNIYLRHICV